MEPFVAGTETPTASRNLDEPIRSVDLKHELDEAWNQLKDVHAGHTARTLYKQSMHRVVLLVIQKGASIPDHRADGECSLYILSGRVTVDVDGERRELDKGDLLGIAFGVPHVVEAHKDSEILLTLSQVR